jgi:formate C-acetyltransferase
MVKLLLMCLNGGPDELHGDKLCPKSFVPKLKGNARSLVSVPAISTDHIQYANIERLYFDIVIPWMVKLYAKTMNSIHYSHNHACYENIQMALHNSTM